MRIEIAHVHFIFLGALIGGARASEVRPCTLENLKNRHLMGGCGRWFSHLWLRRVSWVRFVHDARAIAGPRARGRTVAAAAFSLTIGLAVAVADAAVRSGGAVSASGV